MLNLTDTFLYRRVNPVSKQASNGRASIQSIADLVDATSNIPPGGLLGQALVKNSGVDFDFTWQTLLIPPFPVSRAIGITGDLTWTVNFDGSVDVSAVGTIANDAITYAKFQNVAANSVLARAAATSGDVSAVALSASQLFGRGSTGDLAPITLGTNLSMSGTTLNVTVTGTAGKQTIYVPASAMIPRVTNGAAPGSLETATNRINVATLDFDATTQEFAQFQIAMPKSWNEGTVTFDVEWYHPSTTTNFGVVWSLAGLALSDGNALDTAFGTAVLVTDTGGATNTLYSTPESAAVTIGNTPAENDYVVFQIARVPADAGDTMAVDARLLGVRIFYTTNAENDA